MNIRNVDDAPYSEENGTFSEPYGLRDGLVIDGQVWLIKYPYVWHDEMLSDPVSEYLGSHIYELLGYPVHETMLVERNDKIAVACKDFVDFYGTGEVLLTMRGIKNASVDYHHFLNFNRTGPAQVVYMEELLVHLEHNRIMTKVDGLKERIFDMLVIDFFINNERNDDDWGIVIRREWSDRPAPVYNNGISFYCVTPDSRLEQIMKSEDSMKDSIVNGITVFGTEGEPLLSKDVFKMDIPGLRQAIVRNVPKIKENMENICHLIDELPDKACSPVRKEFYKRSLAIRLELILEPEYEKILNGTI